ncbi:MAG TPA: response regulator transcription factor [Actinomycetota bacterium]|nr:response regulator transcription factor [Actinomycetota bacterium]
MNVLLVEDDTRLAGLLAERLRNEGHGAETAATGTEGLEKALSGTFDIAVVDVMLPELDGLELTRSLRRRNVGVPVLMLTARDAIEDRVAGLRAGADDYLVKPFAFAELLARIEALTRRLGTDRVLTHDGVALDPASRRVTVNEEPVELTAKEFDLLECLMRNAGRVLTRSELKELVWDFSFDARTKVVDLYVHYLRRKLEQAGTPDFIETVRGVGYVVGR